MEPILSKDEIADLLTAIKSGEISTDTVEGGTSQAPRFLQAKELDLFQTYQRAAASGEARIPNFDIIIDMFARNFGTSLTNTLQRSFTVERAELNSTTFQQSLLDLNNQGAVGIFSTDPLKYGCLFHFDTFMAFTLLEIMLGSSVSSESVTLNRNLTTIEISILKNTMMSIAQDLRKAFNPITQMNPSLTKIENNFRLVNIVDAEAEVLVASFQVSVGGEQAGEMRFIIPYLTVEPFREAFKEMVTITQAAYSWSKVFIREAMEMEATVIARSGLIEMTIREILQLQAGDILDLGYDPDRPVDIIVEDQPKFLAIPGERDGKKAFHITNQYNSSTYGESHGNT
ncbi:flagellar motor switch protein FliM [Desulfogranum mediterraneum]|uniref:flagellar motor switch protein FliM n=1 Tax=Desulfogranum mediterraneum TaxID=160661 RepID=UPI0003F5FA84|nr:FliM/FliN family flagellar motor switch protein [Desulfogranum mediterraneum]